MLKKIENDFIAAFKAKQTEVKDCLGLIKSEIVKKQKEKNNSPLDDNEIINVLLSEVKKREQTIDIIKDQLEKNAIELKEKYLRELELIRTYLPKQMTSEEIEIELNKFIELSGINTLKDLISNGMKHFNQNFKGMFDNKLLKSLIEKKYL
jgi:uncharacterized protein YqeY